MHDVKNIRDDLVDGSKGFHVLKQFYSLEETRWYRRMCRDFMQKGPVIHKRINSYTIRDYIHPRSMDRRARTKRIYQFGHNHQQDDVGAFLQRANRVRNEVENQWLDDAIYRAEKEKYQEYTIVTQYLEDAGKLPIHRDYKGPAPFPLIQFWVSLSEPEVDYSGGNLVLISKDGTNCRVESDLNIRMGDAVVFDKSLEHYVEVTKPGSKSDWGRWTVLIGARAEIHSPMRSFVERVLYGDRLYPTTQAITRRVRRIKHLGHKMLRHETGAP